LVWILEAINTAIEALVDLAAPDFHPLAKKAKDIAAGGVLIGAILAVIIGALVFLPKFLI
jgi:undecaprenol kinase